MGKPRIVAKAHHEWSQPDSFTGRDYEFRGEWRMRANGDIEYRAGIKGLATGKFDMESPGWRYAAHIHENRTLQAFNHWVNLTLQIREVQLHGIPD